MTSTNRTRGPAPITMSLDLTEGVRLARAALAAVGTDDVTPVITASQWTLSERRLTAVATDRYRVHRLTVPVNAEGSAEGVFLVPAALLKWIVAHRGYYKRPASLMRRKNPPAPVKLELSFTADAVDVDPKSHAITATIRDTADDALTMHTLTVPGHFPPVARLIKEAEDAEPTSVETMHLKPEFIIATRALGTSSYEAPAMKFTKGSRADRPGPVLITYAEGGQALIQPWLGIRAAS